MSLAENGSDVYLRESGQLVSRDGHSLLLLQERLFNITEQYAIMLQCRVAIIARMVNSLSGLPRIDPIINPLPSTEHRVIAVRNSLSRVISNGNGITYINRLKSSPDGILRATDVIAPSDD